MPASLGMALAIALVFLLGLFASLEVGYRLGRRLTGARDGAISGQVGAIQGATLGLLGLLLAFSFGGAGARFLERQDLIVQEANAIGTTYLRAELLDEPYASRVRDVLERYVRHRLEIARNISSGLPSDMASKVAEFHRELWQAASEGAKTKPATLMVVLDPVNQVIDLHSTRVAAGKKHLPWPIIGLLAMCSLLAMAVIGYGCGLTERRSLPLTLSLALLVAAALWVTIDLDNPRAGFIRVSDQPLEQLGFDAPR